MIKKQKTLFILLFGLFPNIIFSQSFGPWETIYNDNQLSVEVQFKIEPSSCLNSVKNKIQYRINGKLSSLDYYLIWTTDYKDCSGNVFFQEHSLNISSGNALANGTDIALGDTWPSIEDEFLADKVLVKFYNVHTSNSPSNLSGIKGWAQTEKKAEVSNNKAEVEESNCYTKWAHKFQERGAEYVADGTYRDVIISIRSEADAECYNGKCDVKDGKVIAMYIKMGNGAFEQIKKKSRYENVPLVIKNGISTPLLTMEGELIHVLFVKKIKPKKAGFVKAADPTDN